MIPAGTVDRDLPCRITDPCDGDALFSVQTYYEKMFLKQGLKITYLSFTLDHEGPFVSPESFDADYWKKRETPRKTFGIQV